VLLVRELDVATQDAMLVAMSPIFAPTARLIVDLRACLGMMPLGVWASLMGACR
jgi:hypothetical protein